MRGVVRLARLGVRSGGRLPVALLVLVLAVASAGIATSAVVRDGSAARVDAAFSAGNGPDVVVIVAASQGEAALAAVSADPRVAAAAPPRRGTTASMRVDATHSIEHLVTVADPDPTAVGHPVLRSGRVPDRADEVLLDAAIALDQHIGVGDRVVVDGGDGAVSFTVVGTAIDFVDCFFPSCDPGRSWMAPSGLARLGGPTLAVVGATLRPGSSASAVEERLQRELPAAGINTWPDTRADILAPTDLFATFLRVFGAFVAVAAAVVISAALAARVIGRRRHIGLLKALGASPKQVLAAVLLEHAGLALIGAVLGWAVAGVLAPRFTIGPMRLLGRDGASFEVARLATCVGVCVGLVVVSAGVAAWRSARVEPVAALRGSGRGGRPRAVVRVLAARLPVRADLGLRSWTARPSRTAFGVLALALATVAGVVTVSIEHAVDGLLARPEMLGDPWDATIEPGAAGPAELQRRLAAIPEVGSWFTMVETAGIVDNGRVHVRLLGGEAAAASFAVGAGRLPEADGEAIAGYGLFEAEGWQVGDEVEVSIAGVDTEVHLVGWYRETEDAGRLLQVRTASPLAGSTPTYAIHAAAGVDTEHLASALADVGGRVVPNEPDGSDMAPFRTAMWTLSLLVAAVALAHVGATALSSARQRSRDTAALRAIGCSSAEIGGAAATSAAATAVAAVAIGVPAGSLLQRWIGDAITSGAGIGPGASNRPPLLVLVFVGAVVAGLAVAVEVVTALRASRSRSSRVE